MQVQADNKGTLLLEVQEEIFFEYQRTHEQETTKEFSHKSFIRTGITPDAERG